MTFLFLLLNIVPIVYSKCSRNWCLCASLCHGVISSESLVAP